MTGRERRSGKVGGTTRVQAKERPDIAPGKRTLTGRLSSPVQLRSVKRSEADPAQVQERAAEGIAGPASPLPHGDRIQSSFGSRDISQVKAHVGGEAAAAADDIGAVAYASGDHVAFATQPDLHTVAHEAAHVVQQQHGVQLAGGIGQAGDEHERQADAVADAVAAGGSAEPLLGSVDARASGRRNCEPCAGPVQRQPAKDQKWPHEIIEESAQQPAKWPHEIIADSVSRTGEPTTARRERDYEEAAALEVGDGHYRLWGFEVDSAGLRTEFATILSTAAQRLHTSPEPKVLIVGHTSTSGAEATNFGLSVERAICILQQLAARGVSTERILAVGVGETEPIADEASGPSAMARNRRVEVIITPAPDAEDPQAASDAEPTSPNSVGGRYSISCAEAELWMNVAMAEIQVWTMLQSGGRDPVTLKPRQSFGEDYMQPSLVDWRAACLSNDVPEAWCEELYRTLILPVDANLLEHINGKWDEMRHYKAKRDSSTSCGAGAVPTPNNVPPKRDRAPQSDSGEKDWWLDEQEPWKEGPMPGDIDAKGRLR